MGLKRTWMSSLVISILLLALPMLPGEWWHNFLFASFGRLHPLLLHLPLITIIMTAYMEWRFGTHTGWGIRTTIAGLYRVSYIGALLTAVAGFLLFRTGDYEYEGVSRHLWAGIVLALLLVWTLHFKKLYQRTRKWRLREMYRILLFAATLLVFYTGHTGGSLTHGANFVVEPIQDRINAHRLSQTKALKEPAAMLLYGDVILPAFQNRCLNCHNQKRSKGGLDLSTYEAMIQGGKSGKPAITSGYPEQSEVYQRVTLSPDHDDYMPPEGKKGLEEIEVALLRWWIERGASLTDTLGEGPADASVQAQLASYLPKLAGQQLAAYQKRSERLKMGPKLKRKIFELGMDVELDPDTDSAYYALSMRLPARRVTDETLRDLMPYRHLFSRVSLASADITDEGLYYLGQMPNLRRLILTKCCINGEGLMYLEDLPQLHLLTLSHTDLSNAHALKLSRFQALRKVYMFNTFVEPSMIQALDQHLEQARITVEEGPYY